MNIEKEILERISRVEIDCPDCEWVEDDQYTCTTCWNQGGNGRINVSTWLKEQEYKKLNDKRNT